jgi:hypothetical protein
MLTSLLSPRLRSNTSDHGVVRAYRDRFAQARARREHDDAMASDHRFASDHRLQASRSVDLGRGGCPFCD